MKGTSGGLGVALWKLVLLLLQTLEKGKLLQMEVT